MADNNDKSLPRPTALSLHDAARLLTKASGQLVSEEMLLGHIAAGAPTNPDGTINLVHYAAWLVKEMSRRIDGD
jgi:hypothetical protein